MISLDKNIRSVSFDIDGTLYPMRKAHRRWWARFLRHPIEAATFLSIKRKWEQRRKGNAIAIENEDIEAFEGFLLKLYAPDFVSHDMKDWLKTLGQSVRVIYLSDHGASQKVKALGLPAAESFDCLRETGELKPHQKIAMQFLEKFSLDPATHLHIGDRWTDEEQARLMKCHFELFFAL